MSRRRNLAPPSSAPSLLAVFLFPLLIAGCQPTGESSKLALPDADEEAIRLIIQQYDHGINTGDANEFLSIFAADAIVMPPGQPALIGSSAIRDGIQESLVARETEIHTTIQEITVNRENVIIWLTYKAIRTPMESTESTTEIGKGVQIFKMQPNGSWRISREIWNTDE